MRWAGRPRQWTEDCEGSAMCILGRCSLLGSALWIGMCGAVTAQPPKDAPKGRTVLFTYSAVVTGLAPGQAADVWLPVPPSNAYQQVTVAERALPAAAKIGKEARFGNE